ncbi:TPA: hypothetical protein ACJHSG_003583 [Salmonella enterica subsp. enterica serovar Aberdeen]|uniref:Uncharacterized protein n=1 Tax=Salmonella enterica TaxID=28901 RepID=A0A750LEH8_SALER|nr:hypothetical protein [Salmonella enterica subsp. enterica serovar Aberdeen]EEU8150124.1 hypothetical protein [Salmonella enterica]HAF6395476.1 hypothetical protein [Salmonella enterica]HCH8504601.1 hypothetical protein [Salmonella enterica]HDI5624222.1 hypothetical protein [Salmonella enterica]
MMDQLLQYATNRIIELENVLLVDVPETVWPAVFYFGWLTKIEKYENIWFTNSKKSET